jgi:LacI family transcriptional regulator
LRGCVAVSANADRSSQGVASIFPDEEHIAELALSHMLARGLRDLTTFRFDESPFALIRERHFLRAAEKAGARLEPRWWIDAAVPARSEERPAAVERWLISLKKPCGVFVCCDSWGRVVMRCAQTARIRVPEDIALVGVDNDTIECELMAPPLSSVAVPWRTLGEGAARLVASGLRGETIAGKRILVAPLDVVARRSSDTFAIEDPLVAAAVSWIQAHAERRLSVSVIASALGATRQRLERHFRASLGRSVMQEVRRAHVELARRLLRTTEHSLTDVAKRSGFTNAALLSVAFRREIGVPPGTYRRRTREFGSEDA